MLHPEYVGKTIKKLRTEEGMSQAALAEALYVSHQAVSRWENGSTIPSIDTLMGIRTLFDVPLESLFVDPQEITSQEAMTLLEGSGRDTTLYAIADGRIDSLKVEDIIHRLDDNERMTIIRRMLDKRTPFDLEELFPRLLYSERRMVIDHYIDTGYPESCMRIKDLMSRHERQLIKRRKNR